MIFTRLTIENFGVYRGEHRFDLRPYVEGDDARTIVLFGGKNGSGKTTILEAIRLCLYGRSALGNRVRKRDYETYIAQRIHRGAQHARIGLTFEHTHSGVRSVYEAIRSWRLDSKRNEETILVYKNGETLHDIPAENWGDFLRDLIPPGVADLFFFDGEQIQALASESTEADALADAIRGLLNLDLIERLQSDLITYVRRQQGKDRGTLQKRAEQLDEQRERLLERLREHKQDRATLVAQLDHANKSIESARQMLLQEGGGFVERRDEMETRRNAIDSEIQRTRTAIHDMAADLVPFALVPAWNRRLHERLELEAAAKRERTSHEVLHRKASEVAARLSAPGFRDQFAPELDDQAWGVLVDEITVTITGGGDYADVQMRHHISEQTAESIQNWMAQAMDETPVTLHELSLALERLEEERGELEVALKRAPAEDVTTPLLNTFHRWANEQGRLTEQIEATDEELKRLKLQADELERESRRAWKELAQAADLDARVERAAKAQVILDQYLERITQEKTAELQDQFLGYFSALMRKKHFVRDVTIDPQTFQVTLYGEEGEVIPKTDLSAGEKQLYAMALLWALRAVSGRALPIIMDTPMGRLDTDHRTAILDHFLPLAAHQMIVLSTDTEIDVHAFERIQEDISHAYQLAYDDDAGCTQVVDGYFGQAA